LQPNRFTGEWPAGWQRGANLDKLKQTGMSGKPMKSLARNSTLALLGVTGLLALPASAAEKIGAYAGLQAGSSYTDTSKNVIEFDDSHTWGIYGGYKFLDWLGAEVGYSHLGQFDVDTLGGEDVSSGTTIEMNSWHAAISLWGPFIGTAQAFAKLGGHYSESKLEHNDDTGNDYKKNTTHLYYSVGVEIPVVDAVSITFAYENFRNIDILTESSGVDLGHAGVDAYSLGVLFNF